MRNLTPPSLSPSPSPSRSRSRSRSRSPSPRCLAAASALVLALPALGAPPAPAPVKQVAPAAEQTPLARALAVADALPFAKAAHREARHAAAEIRDPPLRAALEAQLAAPWLPRDTWALTHRAEAETLLRAEKLLADAEPLPLPAAQQGSFAAAPGGPCPGGHHAYPGGLAVHTTANLLHARGLAQAYLKVYGVRLDDDLLVAASLWHDVMKALTLPWDPSGGCPDHEPQLAGTALHHVLGLSAAISRRLPTAVLWSIASAHAAPQGDGLAKVCGYLRAASILAKGSPGAVPCPREGQGPKVPLEAFVTNLADADYSLTGPAWTSYAAATPAGWAHFAALAQDGNELVVWQRAAQAQHAPE